MVHNLESQIFHQHFPNADLFEYTEVCWSSWMPKNVLGIITIEDLEEPLSIVTKSN